MTLEVRLSDAAFVDELLQTLKRIEARVARRGKRRLVLLPADGNVPGPETEEMSLELLFFLRSWALSHPGLRFELVENGAELR